MHLISKLISIKLHTAEEVREPKKFCFSLKSESQIGMRLRNQISTPLLNQIS